MAQASHRWVGKLGSGSAQVDPPNLSIFSEERRGEELVERKGIGGGDGAMVVVVEEVSGDGRYVSSNGGDAWWWWWW